MSEPGREHSLGGRETHVKHTPTGESDSPGEVLARERELLRMKARLLVEGRIRESRTAWIGMRVPPTVKSLYDKAPEHVKLAARRAFEAVILAWALGVSGVTQNVPQGQPTVYNINININEPRAEVKVDTSKLVEVVERLYELRKPLPPLQRELVERLWRLVREGRN